MMNEMEMNKSEFMDRLNQMMLASKREEVLK